MHRSVNWPAVPDRLRISDQRLEVTEGGVTRAVDLAEVAGLLVYEDGVRHVQGPDGYGLTIDPRAWARGNAVAERLDRLVPRDLHLPHPPRPDRPPVERAGLLRRWWYAALRWLRGPASSRAGAVVGVLLVLAVAAAGWLLLTDAEDEPARLAVVVLATLGSAVYYGVRESRRE